MTKSLRRHTPPMLLSTTFYCPTIIPTRIIPRLPLRRKLCSKSLQALSANTESLSTKLPKAGPQFRPAAVCARSFSPVPACRSGTQNMGDSPKTDGVASPNGHAAAATPASLANYSFPEGRLKTLSDSTKTPLILMACGSLLVSEDHSNGRFLFY